MKTAAEIVTYLIRHYQEKSGKVPKNLLPEKIDDLVGQMGNFLETRLEEDTPHKVIWDEFKDQPEDNSASLIGILEALFEAQPAVRERVNGFMQEVTTIEAKGPNESETKRGVGSNLKSEAGGLITDRDENADMLADSKLEKNPPAYLYGNERPGFESSPQAPVSKPFMVGENAQIVFDPTVKVQFPSLFEHLTELVETSEDLSIENKNQLQENLQKIRYQLTGKQSYQEPEVAQSIESIWEISPTIADALIQSLQSDIEALPIDARDFIIQMHTPLHS